MGLRGWFWSVLQHCSSWFCWPLSGDEGLGGTWKLDFKNFSLKEPLCNEMKLLQKRRALFRKHERGKRRWNQSKEEGKNIRIKGSRVRECHWAEGIDGEWSGEILKTTENKRPLKKGLASWKEGGCLLNKMGFYARSKLDEMKQENKEWASTCFRVYGL